MEYIMFKAIDVTIPLQSVVSSVVVVRVSHLAGIPWDKDCPIVRELLPPCSLEDYEGLPSGRKEFLTRGNFRMSQRSALCNVRSTPM